MSGALIPVHELPRIAWVEARRRRVPLVLLFAGVAIIGLFAAFMWPKKYVSSTSILVQESNIIKPLMEGRAVTTGNADRASIAREVIFSRKIMNEILAAGGWLKEHPSAIEQERVIEGIKQRTSISNLRENLLRIEYADSDPQRSYLIASRLAELFIQQSLAAKERESRDAYQFIDKQVEDYRKKLSAAEDRLKEYRRANVDARPGSETDTNTRISDLRTQIENARMQSMEQRSQEGAVREQLSGESAFSAVQTREFQFRTRLAELQGELDKLRLTYTDQHPDVIRVRHQMQDLEEQVRGAQDVRRQEQASGVRSVEAPIQINPLSVELRSKLAEIRRAGAAASSRMSTSESMLQSELERSRRIADTANELSELQRDYDINRDIYQDLLKRRENARVSMSLDSEHRGLTFDIQEPASLPLRPQGLRFMHFGLAGMGMGLALPLMLLFALMRWDPRVRSASQLEQLTGLPILGSVPQYAGVAHGAYGMSALGWHRKDVMLALVLVAVLAAYVIAVVVKWMSAI